MVPVISPKISMPTKKSTRCTKKQVMWFINCGQDLEPSRCHIITTFPVLLRWVVVSRLLAIVYFIRFRVVSSSISFLSGVFCYDVLHLIDHSFCFFSLPSFTVTTRHHVQLISSKITKMEALLKLKESIEVLLAIHGIKED